MRNRPKNTVAYRADVVVFDPARIGDAATFVQPHQYTEGVDYVLVNGLFVVEDGEVTGRKAGRVLFAVTLRLSASPPLRLSLLAPRPVGPSSGHDCGELLRHQLFSRTVQAHMSWVRRFIHFHKTRHPAEMAEPEVLAFLACQAEVWHASHSTQMQATSALLFLYVWGTATWHDHALHPRLESRGLGVRSPADGLILRPRG